MFKELDDILMFEIIYAFFTRSPSSNELCPCYCCELVNAIPMFIRFDVK